MVVIGSCLLLFAALRKKNIIKKAKRKFDGEIILVGLYTGLLFPDPLRHSTVFPRIIARGDYYYFSHNKGTIFQIMLTGSRALNTLFIIPLNQEMITFKMFQIWFLD